MQRKINLVLVPDTHNHDPQDFHKIAEKIRALCQDVVPYVCLPRQLSWKKWLYAGRPTLYVATRPLKRLNPLRGCKLGGVKMNKAEQYRRLEENNISTPKWESINASTRLSRQDWGDYVVVKPNSGRGGRGVKIKKTGRVKGEKYYDGEEYIVQAFVYTGTEPVVYRALTLFGKVLYLECSRNSNCGHELSGPNKFGEVGGHNIVASARGANRELVRDPMIESFAEKVATICFPNIPVLGIDVMKDALTGELFVAETNPFGQTWHFSSQIGKSMARDHGLEYEKQFGAFDKAAKILIQVARQRAE